MCRKAIIQSNPTKIILFLLHKKRLYLRWQESRDKFKGWVSVPSRIDGVDLSYKKVGDGHPLRLWKFCVEVSAPPVEVLSRILRERHLWDEDLAKWRIVEKLDAQTEVFQYVFNTMVPHPSRDICELRYEFQICMFSYNSFLPVYRVKIINYNS